MAGSDSATAFEGMEPPEAAPRPAAKKQPYRAFEMSSEETRYLEIRPNFPEPAECLSNAMLSYILAEWRAGQLIKLGYGLTREGPVMIVEILGENLTELYRALKKWKVEWLAEFDPEHHAPPMEEAAPFIKSITIHTKRPEKPPPMEQRH